VAAPGRGHPHAARPRRGRGPPAALPRRGPPPAQGHCNAGGKYPARPN
jgi:hypothetical protein